MSFNKNSKEAMIIFGYIRDNCDIMDAPYIIISIIVMFYNDKHIPCNVYNNKWKEITTNATNIYNNNDDIFIILKDGTLFMELDDSIVSIDDTLISDINFISRGSYNEHFFITTKNNKLYSFGSNIHSQAGWKKGEYSSSPILIDYDFLSPLKQIECGKRHTLLLTQNGIVYGCGSNEMGQLLLSNKDNYLITKLPALENMFITQIGCAMATSYAVNNDNKLITFGSDLLGQIGVKNAKENDINIVKINDVDHINVGRYHVGFVTKNYTGYVFGNNQSSQCTAEPKSVLTNRVSNSGVEEPIIILNDIKCVDVKCGGYHTIIKTINNEYYSCGYNDGNICLIFDTDSNEIYSPTKISLKHIYKKTKSKKPIIDIIPCDYKTIILQEM